MVDVALQKNAVKFVHTSSVSVFWPATHMPLTDESPRAALDDWNSYANTKALAELEVGSARAKSQTKKKRKKEKIKGKKKEKENGLANVWRKTTLNGGHFSSLHSLLIKK